MNETKSKKIILYKTQYCTDCMQKHTYIHTAFLVLIPRYAQPLT